MSALTAVCALMVWGLARSPDTIRGPTALAASTNPLTERVSDEGDPGEWAYLRYCSGCHGEKGDGNGPAAVFLFPKPRDFTRGIFKFTSGPVGSLPADDDLLRTITHGLKGTSMPSWRHVSLEERQLIVQYIKTLLPEDEGYGAGGTERWAIQQSEDSPPVTVYANPYDMSDTDELAEAMELGKKIYHERARCWVCHPAYMSRDELETLLGSPSRDDLEKAIAKPDDWGQTILPPDFPTTQLKSVRNTRDLYRVIMAGVGGTAMPTWGALLSDEESWALTLWLDSIRRGGARAATVEEEKQ